MGESGKDGSAVAPESPLALAWLARGLESLHDDVDLRFVAEGRAKPSDPDFDADMVIVGSGYGAAVAARQFAGCRLDGRPLRIVVLERGDEYLRGAFPSRLAELPGHVRFSTPGNPRPRGRRNGLFDVRVGADVMALVANGVGGGSLINAGVMLEPAAEVFLQAAWPQVFRDGLDLAPHFDTVREWLGAGTPERLNTVPTHPPEVLRKTAALLKLPAQKKGVVPITVALNDSDSVAGVPLKACIGCGDCATGCNHGAKISLDVGLLAQACATQAEESTQPERAKLYAGATVLWLEKQPDGRWVVMVQHTDDKLRQRQARPLRLRARFVVLAAGTLGSTEILLRSRQHGLALSPVLGHRFSANGDLIASLQGLKDKAAAVADEDSPPGKRNVGPTITAMIDQRKGAEGFVVQDLAVPGPMRQVFAELFTTAGVLHALPTCDRDPHTPGDIDPCAVNDDAIDLHTLPVAMIGHDDSGGRLTLVTARSPVSAAPPAADDEGDGALRIDWPGLRNDERFRSQHRRLIDVLNDSPLGGRVLPNPAWQLLPSKLQDNLEIPRGPMITVHPLGGCPMGDDPRSGVVDDLGRVFDAEVPAGGDDVTHFGLVVLDGSIVPTSLGINPALTIAALAHRAAQTLRSAKCWNLGEPAPPADDRGPRPRFRDLVHTGPAEPTLVELVERMRGKARLTRFGEVNVELTLFSEPTVLRGRRGQRGLMTPDPDRHIVLDGRRSTLRVWQGDLPPLEEDPKREQLLLTAGLSGSLTIFRHAASAPWPRTLRAFGAWAVNRGVRDLVQRIGDKRLRDLKPCDMVRQTLALASRAGAVRTLDYDLTVHHAEGQLAPLFGAGTAVKGVKRLTYGLKASPLQQLMDMQLTAFPGLAHGRPPTLSLYLPFLAQEAVPLMRVVGQANQPAALADLASFLAYVTRILVDGHLWSFRKPDAAGEREPQRLPGRVPGAPPPQVTEIEVRPAEVANAAIGQLAAPAASIRLTRYCPDKVDTTLPPVLLIHGYSASGTTFAHPMLQPGLMAHLTQKHRRDVWVLDLRSSCGMPAATHPWAFEDMGCEDIPVAVEQVCNATGFEAIDIVAHCMGVAMLMMGLLGRNEFAGTDLLLPRLGVQERLRHKLWDRELIHWDGVDSANAIDPDEKRQARSRIRRLVMSQVGPALKLTPANIARSYLMRYVLQFIGSGRFQFRTTGEPDLGGQLLDRLLAGMPYPPGEFELENPFWPPGQRLPWVGARHRIDALFGRVFNLAHMDQATLEHIDDFFGPFCAETVSQVMYFARYWMITDRSGFNRFVGPQRIRERLTFPMLSLHSAANGLADVSTKDLLLEQIGPHVVPPGSLRCEKLPGTGLGHQDSLIGCEAATRPALEKIVEFLQRPNGAEDEHGR